MSSRTLESVVDDTAYTTGHTPYTTGHTPYRAHGTNPTGRTAHTLQGTHLKGSPPLDYRATL